MNTKTVATALAVALLMLGVPAAQAEAPVPSSACNPNEIDSYLICLAFSLVSEVAYVCNDIFDTCPI